MTVTEDRTAGPYATAVDLYLEAGWRCVLPLPARDKFPPPTGFTGRDGGVPSIGQHQAWKRSHAAGNVGLRLDDGVIGVDVDHYEDKTGGDSLRALEQAWGTLPPTWVSSARPAPSGIRFYRAPAGLELHDKPGPSIEILQRHHRYAVVWPSTNPKAADALYRWITPDGDISDRPPRPDELPVLPVGWIEGLTQPRGPARTTTVNGHDRGERTAAVERALAKSLAEFYGGRHDAAMTGVMALGRLAEREHPGAEEALDDLRQAFLGATGDSRTKDQAEAEWQRMVTGAQDKIGQAPATTPKYEPRTDRDDCSALLGDSLKAPDVNGWDRRAGAHAQADAEARQAAGPAPVRVWTAKELLAADRSFRWSLRGVLCSDTYGQIAGEKKTLKSYLGTFIDVAVASGAPLFGRFEVDTPGAVIAWVGEGGRVPYTRRLERIARAMGVELDNIPLLSVFDVPKIGSPSMTAAISAQLADYSPALVHLDPLYAYHSAQTDSKNLFESGSMLSALSGPCVDAGSNLLISNHFNKTGTGKGLDRITQSGSAEWCDTWLLVSHREAPNVEAGEFKLLLEIGSRQWGGSEWDIDLTVGRFDADLGEFDGDITWNIGRHVDPSDGDKRSAADAKIEMAVLRVLSDQPYELTLTQLAAAVGGNRDRCRDVLSRLLERREIVVGRASRTENGRPRHRNLVGLPTQQRPAGWEE